MESPIPNADLTFLRKEFLRDAKVIDLERGYISASSFNLRMKPAILMAAGRLIAHALKDARVDIIHGIPHSGNFLATAVALAMDKETPTAGKQIRLHSSRKDQHVPATWKDIFRAETRSFTTSNSGMTIFSGINLSFVLPGDRVLLVDDVCATGETGTRLVEGLLKRNVTVAGFAVLFDKVFQGGLEQVARLGITVYSCISVLEIGKHDLITIAQP